MDAGRQNGGCMAIGLLGTAKRRISRTEAARRWLHFLGTDHLCVLEVKNIPCFPGGTNSGSRRL